MNRTHTLQIRTPEGIVFSQRLAGPMLRFLAWLIDAAVVFALLIGLNTVLGLLSIVGGDFIGAVSLLLFFALNFGYGIVLEWRWRGQTIGKRVLRLRVIDAQGLRLQFHQIVTRNLLRAVDMLPVFYLVGGLALLLNRRAQRLGDFAANTVVIRIPSHATPDLDPIDPGKYNSFRDHPHLEARLRQRVSPQEAALALQAIVRRDSLEPAARVTLFADLAAHFRSKVSFPPETAAMITDEQYVRNVLDSIYRKTRTMRPTPTAPASVAPATPAPAAEPPVSL